MIRGDSVEFSGRLVVPGGPGFPAVQADRCSLVHSQHDALGICRIEPHRVIVVSPGRALDGRKRVPAIIRTVQVLRRHIHHISIFRVHENFAHVPRPFDPLIFRRFFPRRSRIV